MVLLVLVYFVFVIVKHPLLGIGVEQDEEGRYIVSSVARMHWGEKHARIGDEIVWIDQLHPSKHHGVEQYGRVERAERLDILRVDENGERSQWRLVVDSQLPMSEMMFQLLLPGFVLLVFIGFSVFIYRRKKDDPAAVYLILFFILIGLSYLGGFASARFDSLSRMLFTGCLLFAPAVFIHFLYVYFQRFGGNFISRPSLVLIYVFAILVYAVEAGSIWYRILPYPLDKQLCGLFFIVLNATVIVQLVANYIRFRRNPARSLMRVMLTAHVAAFAPFLLFTLLPQLLQQPEIIPGELSAGFLLVLPLSYVYLFTTQKLFDIDFMLHRISYYLFLSFLPAILMTVILFLLNEQLFTPTNSVQLFLLIQVTLIVLLFGKEKLDQLLQPRMVRQMHQFQQSLNHFVHQMSQVRNKADLNRLFQREVSAVLSITDTAIYELPVTGQHPDQRRSRIMAVLQRMKRVPEIGAVIPLQEGNVAVLSREEERTTVLWFGDKENHTALHGDQLQWLQAMTHFYHLAYKNIHLLEMMAEDIQSLVTDHYETAPDWLVRVLYRLAEQERQKLASDLHDDALQLLLDLQKELEIMLMMQTEKDWLKERMQNVHHQIQQIAGSIRQTCKELYPPYLLDIGLIASLHELFAEVQIRSKCEIHFQSNLVLQDYSDELQVTLFRIIQELLNNTTRHSWASEAQLKLDQRGKKLFLHYRDNGRGMDLSDKKEELVQAGIAGMKRRIYSMRGKMSIQSEPGNGLEVRIVIPLKS